MRLSPRHRLAESLGEVTSDGSFSVRRTAPVDDLAIRIRGVGELTLPVAAAQAKEMRLIARPAKYGRGEETLLDRRVRDTWEVPRSRVNIDKRRWNQTLLPTLDQVRSDLGLPDGCRLKAELHSMLVYEPGQFFAPHQDSEKADEMIGTLVVVLPSNATGGDLVIEHQGQSVTYRPSRSSLTFVAFYADTRHEIRPVKSGYRVALTYNLLLSGETDGRHVTGVSDAATEAVVKEVVTYLSDHFIEPTEAPSWRRDLEPSDPPDRLVYLLDHEYTERGLSWGRLKGDDTVRAAVLRLAAENSNCDHILVLADIHEVWNCFEDNWPPALVGRGRNRYDEDDRPPDSEGFELSDLIDSGVSLSLPSGATSGAVAPQAEAHELCESTPSIKLRPYESEYQGNMGNYGNTMDRWYRRGAVVLWPRQREFAVRAKGDPGTALDELLADRGDHRETDLVEVRDKIGMLSPFWSSVVRGDQQSSLFPKALEVAHLVDDSYLATGLLAPFSIERLGPTEARPMVALTDRYGLVWAEQRLAGWMGSRDSFARRQSREAEERLAWAGSLPALCEALGRAASTTTGTSTGVARLVLAASWTWLGAALSRAAGRTSPSDRREALETLGLPLGALLQATTKADSADLQAEIINTVCDVNVDLLPCLALAVQQADWIETATGANAGLNDVARYCIIRLEAVLARPERADDNWSIEIPLEQHACDDCATLTTFLTDGATRKVEWPLAKPRRQHIHQVIDREEFPVRHETQRIGRPYTLVLTKTDALFTQEQEARDRDTSDLAAIRDLLA